MLLIGKSGKGLAGDRAEKNLCIIAEDTHYSWTTIFFTFIFFKEKRYFRWVVNVLV